MTDRVHSLTVALDHDIRTDDIEVIRSAILCLRGVIAVENNIADTAVWVAEKRARLDLQNKLWEILNENNH